MTSGGLIAVIITLLASLVAKYMNKVSFKEAVGRQNQSENLTDAVLFFAEGIGVIKSYNLLGEKSDELTENFKKSRDVNTKFEQKMTPWTTGLNILYGVGIAAIFGLSVFLHQEGVLSLAYLLGVLLFVFDLFGPLKALYGEATRLTVMNAALDRIEAVLDEPELPDNGNQHILSQAQPDQPEVQFSDVGFAYQDKEVLHNISFSMQKNTMTALVGPSGGGKSTIANLLARLWDVKSGKPAATLQKVRAGRSSRNFPKKAFPALRSLPKTVMNSRKSNRPQWRASLTSCWCSCLTVSVAVMMKRPLSWNGSRSRASKSGA